jgi:hypothetical protein
MHNEELQNLYALPNIIRMIESRSIKYVGRKHEGKRLLGRPRHRWRILLKQL